MSRSARALALLAISAAVGTAPASLRAQVLGSERVVAVVGNEAILLSELEEQAVIAASQSGVDTNDAAEMAKLRKEVLDQMVSDLVVVAAASVDDSVNVSDADLNEAVEAELDDIRGRFPTPADFEREIARSQWRTLDNYKRNLRRIKQRELLAQAFLQKNAGRIQSPTVTDADVWAYYQGKGAQFGKKPATVTIRELDLIVKPTEPARERAQALADSLLGEIRRGGDFADLARTFSDDKGSAEKGGDLGYFKRGAMVGPFEAAAFGIDSLGGLAGPVESDFGFHIIRLDDRQGDEIKARHILITPAVSDADRAAMKAIAEALVDSLAAGADFDSLAARHSNATRDSLAPVTGPLTQLPPEWQSALKDLPVGKTTGLLTTPAGFAILKLEGRGGGETYTFEELEPRIRAQLEQARGQETFIESLRKRVYVDVRMPETGAVAAALTGPPEPATPDSTGVPPIGAPASLTAGDSLPSAGTPSNVGTAGQAYTPHPGEAEPAPDLPLANPAPLADTAPPEVQNPPLKPSEVGAPERVQPSGAVDSTSAGEPSQP